jgi:hypothetical protein
LLLLLLLLLLLCLYYGDYFLGGWWRWVDDDKVLDDRCVIDEGSKLGLAALTRGERALENVTDYWLLFGCRFVHYIEYSRWTYSCVAGRRSDVDFARRHILAAQSASKHLERSFGLV